MGDGLLTEMRLDMLNTGLAQKHESVTPRPHRRHCIQALRCNDETEQRPPAARSLSQNPCVFFVMMGMSVNSFSWTFSSDSEGTHGSCVGLVAGRRGNYPVLALAIKQTPKLISEL
jgi:hypothetical protein